MDFNAALMIFLSWQFVLLSIVLSGLILAVRRPCEARWPLLGKNALWNALFLNTLPLVLGGLLCLVAKSFPFPQGIVSTSGRVIFGLAAGFASSYVWRLVKPLLEKKAGVEADKAE